MLISRKDGLTPEEVEKVRRPLADNHGSQINWKRATKAAQGFLDKDPSFLRKLGDMLDKSQK